MGCCCTSPIAQQFGRDTAKDDLKRYRKDGPLPTTRALISALQSRGVQGATVLDIGGGVGAIHQELLDAGARSATHVDISLDYLAAARELAAEKGHAAQVRFVDGDFVALAGSVDSADLVTLDRVICCYPDMPSLVEKSAAKARRLYGAVYPRRAWWVRMGLRTINFGMWVSRNAFRVYAHPPQAIDAALQRMGLRRESVQRTFVWEVVVYGRSQPA